MDGPRKDVSLVGSQCCHDLVDPSIVKLDSDGDEPSDIVYVAAHVALKETLLKFLRGNAGGCNLGIKAELLEQPHVTGMRALYYGDDGAQEQLELLG